MSRLVWDEVGSRYYETGTDHGVFYLQNDEGKYPEGVVWNGLTGVTETPGGAEATNLWADNIKYASLRSAETFGCTITAYTYPDEFAQCNGEREIAKGVKIGQQNRKTFGFSYRTIVANDTSSEADDGYKIHLIYGCTASPSEKAFSTVNDSPDAVEMSWDIETNPVPVPGYNPTAYVEIDTRLISADNLKKLEDVLYGGESGATKARLPLPDEIMTLITE